MTEHNHSHTHHHHSIPNDFSKAFLIGILLNIIFVAIESFYGFKINSLALLADVGHNFSDVVGLVLYSLEYSLENLDQMIDIPTVGNE